MSDAPLVLGIDIGTSGTRALLVDDSGHVIATASAEHDLATPQPGWSEQAPDQWWDTTCQASRTLISDHGIAPTRVQAIGFSGQMHGSVFLGDDHKPLRPAILWNDQRTVEQCAQLQDAAGSRAELIRMVGNPPLTGFTAPKLLWLRDHEPQLYEKTHHLLLPKDYVRLRMTGEFATDVGDASGTLLFDVEKRCWHDELISRLGIDRGILPDCYESCEIVGRLTDVAARALQLKPNIPVVAGSGDQPAGAVGNGIVESGIVSATLGTSGVMFAHADQPTYDTMDMGGRVHTMCAAVPGKWCVFGCMLAAGASFQWFRNEMAEPERQRASAEQRDAYELLIELAEQAPQGCEGLYFLPYLTGERCPHPDPYARGGWLGLTTRHDRQIMIRALLEGVTFGMADMLDIIRGDMGIAVDTIRLSGGGARSRFWRQLQADIYNQRTAIIHADEGPAYGAAILAGVGAGMWPSVPDACTAVIRETEHCMPDKQRAEQYAAQHAHYKRLYPALKGLFRDWW